MDKKTNKEKLISRRGMFPILGSTLLIPFLGFGNSKIDNHKNLDGDEEFQTLLKPDGTTVRINNSTLKKSKIIKENISNKSLLNWLGKKL